MAYENDVEDVPGDEFFRHLVNVGENVRNETLALTRLTRQTCMMPGYNWELLPELLAVLKLPFCVHFKRRLILAWLFSRLQTGMNTCVKVLFHRKCIPKFAVYNKRLESLYKAHVFYQMMQACLLELFQCKI